MLRIQEKLIEFTNICRVYSNMFPKDERYILVPQLMRACLSVRLNIREGNIFTDTKRKNFLLISRGSLEETDECMIIALEAEYITDLEYSRFKECFVSIKNMLNAMIIAQKV